MNHSWHWMLGTISGWIISKLFITIPEISNLAGSMSILTGLVMLFVQWPNIKKRVREIINKLKR